MMYQIKFISGENAGSCSKLIPGQSLAIGRSHSNDICLTAGDVSGRHIMIRFRAGGTVSIEVLSSRITKYNDRPVKLGDIIDIAVGDKIQMGENSVFVFESVPQNEQTVSSCNDDDSTVFPENSSSADDEKTASFDVDQLSSNKTHTSSVESAVVTKVESPSAVSKELSEDNVDVGENETVAFQTRIASDDELDEIKKAYKRKHYKKVLMIALPIAIFFAAAISLYVCIKPATEEFLSWPQDKNGRDLDDFRQIAPYLALCYPKVPGMKVGVEGSTVNIVTRIGKLQDVPLYISAMSKTDMKTLNVDHQQAFDLWCEQMRDKDPTVNFSGDKSTVFLNTSRGAGVPISYLSYTRRKGNDDFWGYAVFIRKAETIHSILFDVPFASKWRAERFFKNNIRSMVIYAVRRTMEHWEGAADYRKDSGVEQDLQEAETFMSREAPVYWGRIFYLLRSALIKAAFNKNNEQIERAQKMLIELREQQSVWFSTQKLAYQYAERNGDKNSMRSIQAMSESVFSAEFQFADFRYDLIKRKDWK